MSDATPLVSVGLPVWNGMPYVQESLASLQRQDCENFEVIVCDNASTDGTGEYVRSRAGEDPRIRYHRNDENIGGTRNFNRTFHLARGRYFKWAGADDYVSSGMISRCVEVLERDPSAVLAFPHTVLVDEDGEETTDYDDGSGWDAVRPSERFEFSLTRWGLCNLLYGVIRTDVLGETSLFEDYPGSDLVLQAELAVRGPFRQVQGEFLHRRVHSEATGGLEDEALAQFYVPGRTDSFEAKYLRLFRGLSSTVLSADVSLSEKMSMFGALLRHGIWARKRLSSELATLVRHGGASRRRSGVRPVEDEGGSE